MKRISRIGAIICLAAFIMTMTMGVASAATNLKVVDISPKSDAENMAMDNMGFKVYFSEEVYSNENKKANSKHCRILDNKGKEVPSIVLFSPKEKDLVMVLADTNNKKTKIKGKTKYTVQIDPEFVSAKGNTLADTYESSFTTLNPSTSMKISMAMMGVMVVVMVLATKRGLTDENKRREEKEKREKKENAKVNPYKVAKETGKSVEEVVAAEEKKKAKREAKKARQKKEKKVEIASDNIRVSKRQPVSAAGVDYKALKPKPAPKKDAPKNNQGGGKKKGSKQQQKKKKKK